MLFNNLGSINNLYIKEKKKMKDTFMQFFFTKSINLCCFLLTDLEIFVYHRIKDKYHDYHQLKDKNIYLILLQFHLVYKHH